MADHEDYGQGEAPAAHKATHQDGGDDEISIAGLSGTPAALAAHALLPTVHQDAPALIGAHALLASIHHTKYTDVEAKAAADVQIGIHAGLATVHQDAPGLILTHKGDASAHHAKYTDAAARAAVVDDTAYGDPWNGVTDKAPSKNTVYDKIETMAFGAWTTKNTHTSYEALTHGFVLVYLAAHNEAISCSILTDGSDPPTTVRQRVVIRTYLIPHDVTLSYMPLMCPVKKGDYYQINLTWGTATAYWLPLGA